MSDPGRQQLSRVRRWHGAVTWYVEGGRLLAADQRWFVMHYWRISLEDITSVVLWPVQTHRLRAAAWLLPLALLSWIVWLLHAQDAAAVLLFLGVLAAATEMTLGPRSRARIESPLGNVVLPLTARWRDAAAMQANLTRVFAQNELTQPQNTGPL